MQHAAAGAPLPSQDRVMKLASLQGPVSAIQGVRCGTRAGEPQQWSWHSDSWDCSNATAIAKCGAQTASFVTAPRQKLKA